MALTIGQHVFVEGEEGVVVAEAEAHYSIQFADGQVVEDIWIGEIDTQGQPSLPL
jgi:hypothetical protein